MKFFEKHKVQKIIGIIIIIILLIIIGLYTSIVMSLREGTVKVVEKDQVDENALLSENVPILKEEQIQETVFNVLLIGTDSRDPNAEKGRSDTMMLVSLNQIEGKATIVSFMRDSLLEIPGHGKTKLGHSYAYGGAGLTINTINQTYGLDIQNYVTINFENLQNVIDKLGGIEVPLTAEEANMYYKKGYTHLHEGINVLNGKEALMHARNRSLDSDFGRTRRQRSVMNGIYRKVMSEKDPDAILALVKYCLTQVKTNMEMDVIYDMALKVISMDDLVVQQTSVPASGTYSGGTYQGMSVLNVDIEANKKILEEFLY